MDGITIELPLPAQPPSPAHSWTAHLRVCLRPRRGIAVALRADAASERQPDRRLRPPSAGLAHSVWKLRSALDWRRLWPLVIGAVVGVPVGVSLLTTADPKSVRIAVGAILIVYSLCVLQAAVQGRDKRAAVRRHDNRFRRCAARWIDRPRRHHRHHLVQSARPAQGCCDRTTFQPVAVVVFAIAALLLGAKGSLTLETAKLFALGLPFLFAGTLSR